MKWPLNAEPRAVQLEAFRRSHDKDKFAHYEEQGLGKTASILADYVTFFMRDVIEGHVVLLPNYLKSNWKDEIAKWGVNTRMVVWPDDNIEWLEKPSDEPFTLLMNYEALLHSGGDKLERIVAKRRVMLTCDEPSVLRTHSTRTAKRILALAQYCPIRRIAYGTPDPEDVMDFWAQLRFVGLINGVNPYAFRNRYGIMGGYMGKKVVGRKNEEELSNIMATNTFRALKEDWAKDLPEKLYDVRTIDMLPKQKEQYKSMLDDFYLFLDDHADDIEIHADVVIHQLQKLQQISRGFALQDGKAYDLMPWWKNPALDMLRNTIEQARGKIIVFAYHRHAMDQLAEALKPWNPACLRGGMSATEVEDEKARFNNDRACRVIYGQLTVMARGHTLLGLPGDERCSTTIYYENLYSNEIRLQSEDRNHRFGQDRPVLYLDFIASKADKRAVDILRRKKEATMNFARAIVTALKEGRE